MALAFPSTPTVGDIHTAGALSWRWDGVKWVSDGDGGVEGALLTINRLGEFDTEQKKVEARTNLGLQVIDGGTFF